MKNSVQLILSLTLICVISGTILAFAHAATAERIAATAQRRTTEAVQQVLPPHDTILEPTEILFNGSAFVLYAAEKEGTFAGIAIETTTSAGYGGDIRIMIGLDADGQTSGLAILAHKETPGLGAKITETAFLSRFIGRPTRQTDWRLNKEGGAIQAITAATISSQAVTEAVSNAINAYLQHHPQGV